MEDNKKERTTYVRTKRPKRIPTLIENVSFYYGAFYLVSSFVVMATMIALIFIPGAIDHDNPWYQSPIFFIAFVLISSEIRSKLLKAVSKQARERTDK